MNMSKVWPVENKDHVKNTYWCMVHELIELAQSRLRTTLGMLKKAQHYN